MPGRQYTNSGYRYGFDAQEKDNEIYGSGNLNSAQYWEYDTRLGRRWNMDPITKPWESSYSCFGDNPVVFTDPEGDDIKYHTFKDRVRTAWKRLTSSSFRKDFNVLKDRYNQKDEKGNDKKDLEILTGKSDETLTEAVHNGSTTEGSAHGEQSHKDMLRYNGNTDSKNVAYQTEGEDYVNVEVRKGRTASGDYSLFTSIRPDEFLKWEINVGPRGYENIGIVESHPLAVNLDQKNRATLSYNVRYQAMPTWLSDQATLAGDDFTLTYVIKAMGIPKVYRVERGLFGGWDYRHQKKISNDMPYSKVFKRGATISITQGKK